NDPLTQDIRSPFPEGIKETRGVHKHENRVAKNNFPVEKTDQRQKKEHRDESRAPLPFRQGLFFHGAVSFFKNRRVSGGSVTICFSIGSIRSSSFQRLTTSRAFRKAARARAVSFFRFHRRPTFTQAEASLGSNS